MLDDPFGAEKNAAKEELVAARETELVASCNGVDYMSYKVKAGRSEN